MHSPRPGTCSAGENDFKDLLAQRKALPRLFIVGGQRLESSRDEVPGHGDVAVLQHHHAIALGSIGRAWLRAGILDGSEW